MGWHELFAADWEKAFAFYGELFGWQKADADIGPTGTYQLFSAERADDRRHVHQTSGSMPVPFWLYYFNVDDIDAAAERVKAGGGEVFEGPLEVPGGSWIVRCIDPQGADVRAAGRREAEEASAGSRWSTEWSGISSRGRLVTRPRG